MKKYFFVIMIFFAFSSCDEIGDVKLESGPLDGRWVLQRVSCFCFFGDDFDFSVHKLQFNQNSGELIIENSDETSFISTAGTYEISVQGETIIISGNRKLEYNYEINEDTLTLTFVDNPDIADDEISLQYQKVE